MFVELTSQVGELERKKREELKSKKLAPSGKVPVLESVAKVLHVDPSTVRSWHKDAWQSSNEVAGTLIAKAIEYNREKAFEILDNDARKYVQDIEALKVASLKSKSKSKKR